MDTPIKDTIVDRLLRNAAQRGAQPALHEKSGAGWAPISWRDYADRCLDFAGALVELGHQPGEAIAIMGDACPAWLIADVGAMAARGVPAGIYQTSSGEQAAYIARHCEAKVVVVANAALAAHFTARRADLPHLRQIVVMHGAADDAIGFDAFCAQGRGRRDDVQRRIAAQADDDTATLIYTSGTTGPPKAAMLSNRNLSWVAAAATKMLDLSSTDCSVSYLPLAHVAEQMLSIHVPISAGYPVWFAEAMDKLKDALLAARPTLFLGVPRVWEKFQAALSTKLADATGVKGGIIKWSRSIGLKNGMHMLQTGTPVGVVGLRARIADRLFARKLKAQLGLDRLRVAVSGAAPIGRDVLDFFLSCGVTIHEVYGLTETSGVATFNRPGRGATKLGTVGRAVDGVEVKLADDGEVLVRGPNLFKGYFKDDAATAETLKDGWLYSGDVAELDADGFLRITDRKKDLIITSGGKNVSPQNIEKLLRSIEGVAQAVAVGDRRNFITALLTVDAERAPALAGARGWPTDLATLSAHPAFIEHVQRGVDAANAKLSRVESIRRFHLLARDFSLDAGELTATQKLKRNVVLRSYASQIDGMYREEPRGVSP